MGELLRKILGKKKGCGKLEWDVSEALIFEKKLPSSEEVLSVDFLYGVCLNILHREQERMKDTSVSSEIGRLIELLKSDKKPSSPGYVGRIVQLISQSKFSGGESGCLEIRALITAVKRLYSMDVPQWNVGEIRSVEFDVSNNSLEFCPEWDLSEVHSTGIPCETGDLAKCLKEAN